MMARKIPDPRVYDALNDAVHNVSLLFYPFLSFFPFHTVCCLVVEFIFYTQSVLSYLIQIFRRRYHEQNVAFFLYKL